MLYRPALCLILFALLTASSARSEIMISEFVASNQTGLADEDGDRSDWLELYNSGPEAVAMGGWFLTDDRDQRARWRLPAVTLGPRQSRVVFCSGKDRAVAGRPLHTNFKLSASGGYLAVVRPDRTVAAAWDGYPSQFRDRSYGLAQVVARTDFLSAASPVRYQVPAGDGLGTTWTARTFDDSTWSSGINGLGFEPGVQGFAVRTVVARVPVTSNAVAQTVLDTPAHHSVSASENRPIIDYWNTGGTGHYAGNLAAPALNAGMDVDNFVIEITATVTIPTAGAWTFGVNSNDGFRLTIGAFTTSFDAERSAGDTLVTWAFPAAGQYPLRLVMWSAVGGGEVELFAAPGSRATWTAAPFDLVGDTASGGLAVTAPPAGPGAIAFAPYIATDLQPVMRNVSPCVHARFPFTVADPAAVASLTLSLRTDDGAVVFLNGTEVARRNAPAGVLNHASTAAGARPSADAVTPEAIDLTAFLGELVAGTNVLAIHGLNASAADDDFLLEVGLADVRVSTGTAQYFTAATPGAPNTTAAYLAAAPIVATHAAGFYDTPFALTLASSPGAAIHYTFDGSTPTAADAPYAGSIPIDRTTTVRAVALLAGAAPSPVFTRTFIFLNDVIAQSPTGQRPVVQNPPGAPAPTTTWPASGINGQVLQYGMDPNVVAAAPYDATILADLKAVPTLSIVTDLPNLFDAADGIYVNAGTTGDTAERPISLELILPDGREGFQENAGLRIRGNFSRDGHNPKHSFRCFFRDEFGAGKLRFPFFGADGPPEHDVVDLRTAQDRSWAYLGSSDALFVSDLFARDLLGAMGQPTTRGNFYHLYLNGQYWGLYDSEERINPSFSAATFGGTDADYDIIKTNNLDIEVAAGSDTFWSLLWQKTEAAGVATAAGYQELLGRNPDGTRNPDLPVLLDPVSLADYMLMNFYIENQDGPTYITGREANNFFAVRHRQGGTGWRFMAHDSEYSLFNVNEDITGPYGVGATYLDSNPRRFFERLIGNPEFRLLFADRVQKHCFGNGPLTEAGVAALFRRRTDEADRAVVGESARWGDAQREPAFTRDQTWQPEIGFYFGTWFPQRTGILLNQLRARGYFPSLTAPVITPAGGTVAFGSAVGVSHPNAAGVVYFTIDGSDPRELGGAVAPGAQAYANPFPLTASLTVRARVKDGASWSPLVDATFFPAQDFGSLAITEIHYNPSPGGSSGEPYEFVELHNAGITALDLGGAAFTAGIAFSFPAGTTLAPGGFVVVARDPAAFATRHPDAAVTGPFTGRLDNGGESLTVANSLGVPVLEVTYDDELPWPVAADGHGFSLVPGSGSPGWRASTLTDGSPGAADPASPIPEIVVNEVLSRSQPPLGDYIELHNPTAGPADVSDWWLSDDPAAPQKYRLPPGTIIPAGGYVVFDQTVFDVPPGVPPGFALSGEGDWVMLSSGDATGALTGYTHGFAFKAADEDTSFERHLNSVGDESFPAALTRTPGASNDVPRPASIIINEVQYHPAAGEDEFVELRNPQAIPVDLFFPGDPSTPWRLDGLGFTFPAGTTLAADSLALVVNSNPDDFRAKYAIAATVPIFGPWGGSLADGGERLALEKPLGPAAGLPPAISYIVVDAMRFSDTAPWPPAADGSGPSLQRSAPDSYADDPASWMASGVTPGAKNSPNIPPVVTLIAPAAGTTVSLPTAVILTATASDTDGQVRRVEFFDGGTRLGESTAAPFSLAWRSIAPGPHTLIARAFDSGYASTDSAPVALTAVAPPVTRIMALGDGITQGGQGQASWRYPLFFDLSDSGWAPDFVGPRRGSVDGTIDPVLYPNYSTTFDNDHAGYWDYRADQVLAALDPAAIAVAAPQAVLVHLGTNDVGQNGPAGVTTATSALPAIISRLRQVNPNVVIGLAQVIPIDPATGAYAAHAADVAALNDQTMNLAAALDSAASPILVVDHFSGFDPAHWLTDGVHPNLAGATFMAENWRAILNPILAGTLPTAPVIAHAPKDLTAVGGEPVSLTISAGGHAPLTYRWRRNGVEVPGAIHPVLTIPNPSPADSGRFDVIVSSPEGTTTSPAATLTVTPGPVLRTLIDPGSAWKYRDTGADLGTAWRALAFADATWSSGRAVLGYGDSQTTRVEDNPTPGYLAADSNRFITTYFRHAFALADAAAVQGLRLGFARDDGIVIYLNGTEVWRDNLPSGPIAASTLALEAIGGADETRLAEVTLPVSAVALLHDGQNVVAAEIHQQATDSSDISFDLSLTAVFDGTPPAIAIPPADLTVVEGWPARLTVTATGGAPLRYQWSRDGQLLAGATAAALNLVDASAGTAGRYTVTVSNDAGSATSPPATLIVLPLPVLETHAVSGDRGTIHLQFTADPSLTYDLLGSATLVDWQVLDTITGQSGPAQFTRVMGGDGPGHFYRLRVSPGS